MFSDMFNSDFHFLGGLHDTNKKNCTQFLYIALCNADTCVKQVQFTDVVGMVSFAEHFTANTEACVVDCTRNSQCKSVLVRAMAAGGSTCIFYSRAATGNELRFLGDGAPVSYIEVLDICPNPNMITSLADVSASNRQMLQSKILYCFIHFFIIFLSFYS